jgi:hypothetical protein
MSREIMIGGHWVTVPSGYIQAETEYTRDEQLIFENTKCRVKREAARQEILAKRVEFYELYKIGKFTFPAEPTPKPETLWQTMGRYIGLGLR